MHSSSLIESHFTCAILAWKIKAKRYCISRKIRCEFEILIGILIVVVVYSGAIAVFECGKF